MKRLFFGFAAKIWLCFLVLGLFASCHRTHDVTPQTDACGKNGVYQWSVVAQNCIELAKNCIKLSASTYKTNKINENVYILFDESMAVVELFFPEKMQSILLQYTPNHDGMVWQSNQYKLIAWEGYELQINNEPAYVWLP